MSSAPLKLQPAIYGGLFIGVLSALPFVNLGNCLCCMWVVGGGVLATYLMQQNHPYPVAAADGALVGLLAGVAGGVLAGLLAIPIAMVMGPFQQRFVESIAANPDVPEQYRELLGNMGRGGALGLFGLAVALVNVVIYSVFAMLGGLLGVALFKKKDQPPAGTVEVLPPA